MNDDLLRQMLAAGLLRIEQRLDAIEEALEFCRRRETCAGADTSSTDYADLEETIRYYFDDAAFTANGLIAAANDDGTVLDAVAPLVDLDGARPAIVLGRILNKLPGVERLPGRIALYRLRR